MSELDNFPSDLLAFFWKRFEFSHHLEQSLKKSWQFDKLFIRLTQWPIQNFLFKTTITQCGKCMIAITWCWSAVHVCACVCFVKKTKEAQRKLLTESVEIKCFVIFSPGLFHWYNRCNQIITFYNFFPIPSSVHLTCLSFSSPHPPIIICSVHFLDCLFFFSVSHFAAFSPLFPVCLIYPSIMSSLWFFIFCPHSCHPGSIILLLSQSLLSPAYISPSLISPQLPVFSSTRRGHIAGKHSPLPA